MLSATLGSEEPTNVSGHIECKGFLSCAYNCTPVRKEAHYHVVKLPSPFSSRTPESRRKKAGVLSMETGFMNTQALLEEA